MNKRLKSRLEGEAGRGVASSVNAVPARQHVETGPAIAAYLQPWVHSHRGR